MPDTEVRASYTDTIISAHSAAVQGTVTYSTPTAAREACASMWSRGLSAGKVSGTDLLTAPVLAMIGRSLCLSGESLWVIDVSQSGLVELIPAANWDIDSGNPIGNPNGDMPPISQCHRATVQSRLRVQAVLHFRYGVSPSMPWATGNSPFTTSGLTSVKC